MALSEIGSEVVSGAVKGAPLAAAQGSSYYFGFTLSDWVSIIGIVYGLLLILWFTYRCSRILWLEWSGKKAPKGGDIVDPK